MTWKEINSRWTAESPAFFKKIQNLGVTLTATGVAATAVPAIPSAHIPAIVTTLGGYAITAGICIGIVSRLTCKDTPDTTKP